MSGLPSNFDDAEAAAIASLKSGEPLAIEEEVVEEDVVQEDDGFSMDDYGDADDAQSEVQAQDAQDDEADNKDTAESIEYVKADGQKIKVDFNDREHIKNVYKLAAGARKWQSERDSLLKEKEEMSEGYTKLRTAMDKLEAVKDDEAALYNLITGRDLNDLVAKRQAELDELALLSPEELEARNRMSEFDRRQAELERREAAIQAKLEEAESKLGKTKQETQQSMVNDAFNKHRFHGKLDNRDDEHELDTMFFSRVKERLKSYDDEDLTPELVSREVEAIGTTLRRMFKVQTDKKADEIIKRRKNSVATKVQSKLKTDPDKQTKRRELASKIKSNDINGIMANMGDFFKAL